MKKKRYRSFADVAWRNINVRCGEGLYHYDSAKNRAYRNVKILFTREEFYAWVNSKKSEISSLQRPSIDRIDKNLNYTLGNIQVIELVDNIRKDKTLMTPSGGCCSKCKRFLPLEKFCKDSRRALGVTTTCRECDRLRGLDKYQRLYKKQK